MKVSSTGCSATRGLAQSDKAVEINHEYLLSGSHKKYLLNE